MFGRDGVDDTPPPAVERCSKCGAAAGRKRPMVHEYDVTVVGGAAQVRCLPCFDDAADAGTPVRFG